MGTQLGHSRAAGSEVGFLSRRRTRTLPIKECACANNELFGSCTNKIYLQTSYLPILYYFIIIKMSILKKTYNVSDAKSFELYMFLDDEGNLLFKAKDVAVALEFVNTEQAIRKNVDECDRVTWDKVRSGRADLVTPSNWQPKTTLINESGLYSLVLSSRKPEAKLFKRWVTSEVLPSIHRTGGYNIREGNGTSLAEYDKKLADVQMDAMKLKLELSEAHTTIAKCDTTVSEMKRNYEQQISQYKEREYKMQLQMKDLANAANMTMTQFAVNALLAKDNIEENEQMRQTLTNVSGRVVPEMTEQPHKEEYITGYERTVNGKRRIRMCRSQLNEIEQQDKAIQRYREEVPHGKKPNLSKRYAWLRDSEKFLQLKCPNPVMVWLKVRTARPHMFYGLRYTNKLRTEMEVLDEQELRQKYRTDMEVCKRNRNIHSKMIEEFKALNMCDENDCVEKCLTPSVEAKERINAVIEVIVGDMSKDLTPSTPQRRHSNAGETYSTEQLIHTMNHCQNYFVKNVFNINNYFAHEHGTTALVARTSSL